MLHLFSAWREVAPQLRSARHLLLLSDYDGTLTPIVERPELAELYPKTRKMLQKLTHSHNLTIGVVSGRALGDLKSRVGLEGIIYAGNHGLEIEGPGLSFVNPLAQEVKPLLRLLHLALAQAFLAIRGVFVENKGLTLSVHYRQVEEARTREVASSFENVVSLSRAVGKIRTTTGKKVYEVRPAIDWDKGKAVELLLDRYSRGGKAKVLPIYLGDDLTDEEGFRAIENHSGISVFVGEEGTKSSARYFLKSTQEVERLLELLLELRGRPGNGLA